MILIICLCFILWHYMIPGTKRYFVKQFPQFFLLYDAAIKYFLQEVEMTGLTNEQVQERIAEGKS